MSYVHGIFNVAKVLTYLRGIDAEVSDETAQQWRDLENLSRALKQTVRWCRGYRCDKNHRWQYTRKRRVRNDETCPECGQKYREAWLVWSESGDGRIKHYDHTTIRGLLGIDDPEDEPWKGA